MARQLIRRLETRAKRVQALRNAGHHAEVRHMADTWTKSKPNNIKGFYDPKKAKAK